MWAQNVTSYKTVGVFCQGALICSGTIRLLWLYMLFLRNVADIYQSAICSQQKFFMLPSFKALMEGGQLGRLEIASFLADSVCYLFVLQEHLSSNALIAIHVFKLSSFSCICLNHERNPSFLFSII